MGSDELTLALVLTPLGRNSSSLVNFYWTPLLEAWKSAGIALTVHQPARPVASFKAERNARRRAARRLPLVSPSFVISLIRARPKFVLATEYGPHTLLALATARLIRAKGLIFKEHSDCAGLSSRRLLYRKLLTCLAHGTIANTDAARHDVISFLGSGPDRVYRVTMLVPPTTDQLKQGPKTPLSSASRPVFLFVGRLIESKNVRALVDASSILTRDNHNFSVRIVGEGPELVPLAQIVQELDLTDIVTFQGPVGYDSVGYLYEASDVFVMPTLNDYRSVSVLEAMRFGLPVIDSSCDGNSGDSVRDGVNGYVFEPDDTHRLVWAMRQFIENRDLIHTMGARSAEFMSAQTPSSAAEALKAVLMEMRPARAVLRRF